MNKIIAAEHFRKALLKFAQTLGEEDAMEIAHVYDRWESGKTYKVGDYATYGVNGVGDPQLYRAVSAHKAQSTWTPDTVPSLWEAIGLDSDGYPIWSQPSGAQDAYNKGDIVNYNGVLYESTMDGNVWSPDAYPQGWQIFER